MNKTKIDWADMTWNPVTGCLNQCPYCYARQIAERFGLAFAPKLGDPGLDGCKYDSRAGIDTILSLNAPYRIAGQIQPYPMAFMPTFHRYRLAEPVKIKKPQNIFVCSMADLFGDWVPLSWMCETFDACKAAPWHRYLFLTKNPHRYFISQSRGRLPYEFWYGTTVTTGKGEYFSHSEYRSFLSIEPIVCPVNIDRRPQQVLPDWLIVGAETGNRKGKVIPKREWIDDILAACVRANVPIFMKESLRAIMGEDFIQMYPWEVTK